MQDDDDIMASETPTIGGTDVLRGLMLYVAGIALATLNVYLVVAISHARRTAHVDATLVASAAALTGVLGGALALVIGTPTPAADANLRLREALRSAATRPQRGRAYLYRAVSIRPPTRSSASWPLTFCIWSFTVSASALAVAYIFNQGETPGSIKTLAVVDAGLVIALVSSAYGLGSAAARISDADVTQLVNYHGVLSARVLDAAGKTVDMSGDGDAKPELVEVTIGPKPVPEALHVEVSIEQGVDAPVAPFEVQIDSDLLALRSPPVALRPRVRGDAVKAAFDFPVRARNEVSGDSMFVRLTQRGRLIQILSLESILRTNAPRALPSSSRASVAPDTAVSEDPFGGTPSG